MHQPFAGAIFAVDGHAFHWEDVVRHARATGRWAALEAEVRLGLAAAAALDAEPDEEVEAHVDAQADEFRYERDLLTAAEMEAWLAARGLSARHWLDCMRGIALRALWHDRADELLDAHPPAAAAVAAALDVELACTELPFRLAEALAADAAAAAAVGRRLDPDGIVAGAAQFRAAAAGPDAVAREIAAHRMEWVRVDCVAAAFGDLPQAREAVLCVREDGLPLAAVAADAHVDAHEEAFLLDEIDAELRPRFLAAAVGDVVGPLERDGAHLLWQVRARVLPEPGDPELAALAAEALEARAVAVEVERRVRWAIPRADAA